MKNRFLALALLAPLAATFALSSDARACGGFFVPTETNAVVNGHRMAVSISPTQTVLWDQIQYKGDPASWGWLLPVKPGAIVEISTDAWFETLDAATTTNVSAPSVNCTSGSGFGCGVSEGALPPSVGLNGVQVVHRGTIGPFETVTLSTKTPGVLDDWLAGAGFNIPADAAPVIDAYIKEGFDFIALKLQPGKNIDEMKPVRVIQPGANPTLPLRMVSVGSGANVAITLYIIGEGRWEAKNFANTQIPIDLLSWDFAKNTSNYSELRDMVLKQHDGGAWLTTMAKPHLLMERGSRTFAVNTNNDNFTNVFGEMYVQQGLRNGETTDSACSTTFAPFANSGQIVTDPCPPGVPSYDPSCDVVPADETDARLFECGATDELPDSTLDDIATAMTGLRPKDVWVTRLEANLPRAALANDLVIAAAENQIEMSPDLQARLGKNVDSFCGAGAIPLNETTPRNDDKDRLLVIATLLGAGVLAFSRKRFRHTHVPSMS